MKKTILFILLFLSALQMLNGQNFRHIGLVDGLVQPSVMAICRDKIGRMWFGTREGVNVWDGDMMTSYRGWIKETAENDSLWIGSNVTQILNDKLDYLYILIDENFIKYDLQKDCFSKVESGVRAMTSYQGDIYFMKKDSLFSYDAQENQKSFVLKTSLNGSLHALHITDDLVYLGYEEGLYTINRRTYEEKCLLEEKSINNIFESSQKEMWIGTNGDGLYRIDQSYSLIHVPYAPGTKYGVSSLQVRQFVEDDEHDIWFGTFDGLQKYDYQNKQYELVRLPLYKGGMTHLSVFSLYRDNQGTIWTGSYYGGVNYFVPAQNKLVHYDYETTSDYDLYYSYISGIVMDKHGQFWIATDGGGLCHLDENWNVVKRYYSNQSNSIPHNNIRCIAYDEERDQLYIGTHLGGLSMLDIPSGKFHNFLFDADYDITSTPGSIINDIQTYRNKIYIAARNAFFLFDPVTKKFTKLPIPYTTKFTFDSSNMLYSLSEGNIYQNVLSMDEPSSTIVNAFSSIKASFNSILYARNGVYVSTNGEGLFFYNLETKKLMQYTHEKNQLPSDYCYNLKLTPSQNILIASDKGVTFFSPSLQTFQSIDISKIITNAYVIKDCGILTTGDGSIYVGDTKGFSRLHESDFGQENAYKNINFYFTNLWIGDQRISPANHPDILSATLPFTDHITLNHWQNNLSFRYVSSDYSQHISEKTYRYMLYGFDKDWLITNQSELHYTNLTPGSYVLKVDALDNNLNPYSEITLNITIRQPWYNTWWAWCLYVFIVLSLLTYYIWNKEVQRKLALSLERERYQKEQNEKLNQEKLVFFTNVSHEFRTPLTLIMSHVDLLLQKSSLDSYVYNQILKVKKSTQKMNYLISELLEFRKLEQNHEKLSVQYVDIIPYLKEIYLSFVDYSQQRGLNYLFDIQESHLKAWVDVNLMERVFYNLISNAFKYTEKGTIRISGTTDGDKLRIQVADTGIGMTNEDATKVFNRFYTVEQDDSSKYKGFGIGLALSKMIVEKHHGLLTLDTKLGEGTTFTVTLPTSREVFANDKQVDIKDEEVEPTVLTESMPDYLKSDMMDETEGEAVQEKKYTILLVEDNEELLQVLTELFEPFYQIITATNGVDGLEQVKRNDIDIIVSDVMMPKMSGTEMCLQIKGNADYCHIPIVLLTALGTVEQSIEGLNRGADAYIAKPFNARLLLARVNNLIRNRLLIQQQFDKKSVNDIDLTSVNPLDQAFLKKVSESIDQHLDDTSYSIPTLCADVAMSKSILYLKFKALTGMTPNNYILNYRLKTAALMLQKYPDLPIAEISARCGFNTSYYFSQCFKKQYGMTPQQYKKEQGAK